jgi:hypothetical protein
MCQQVDRLLVGSWEDGKIDSTMEAIVSSHYSFFVSDSTDPSLTGVAS